MKTLTIGLLSSRSQKHRSNRTPASGKRRPAANGLSQDELLAKIDALDWDQTVSPNTVVADNSAQTAGGSADQGSSPGWWLAASVAGLICVAAVAYYVLVPAEPQERQPLAQVSGAITASSGQTVDGTVPAQRAMTEGLAAVAASEERRAERYEQAVKAAELEAERKAERRQARETRRAERAKVAAQKERERVQQEEAARLRVQREAEEAARLAAVRAREQAAPKGPASPQEACAGEGNFIARGLCETRLCGKPEWRSHAQCVKRFDDQLRALNSGN